MPRAPAQDGRPSALHTSRVGLALIEGRAFESVDGQELVRERWCALVCLLDACRLERALIHLRSAAQVYHRLRRAGKGCLFTIAVRCANLGEDTCHVYAVDKMHEVMELALGRLAFGYPGSGTSLRALCAVHAASASVLHVDDTLETNGVGDGATLHLHVKLCGGKDGLRPPGGEAEDAPISDARRGAGEEMGELPGQPEQPAAPAPAPVEPSSGPACLPCEVGESNAGDAADMEGVSAVPVQEALAGQVSRLGLRYREEGSEGKIAGEDLCDLEEAEKQLKARGATVDADGKLDLREANFVSGLKWHSVGAVPPAGGLALEHPALSEALRNKTVFQQHEWEAFEGWDAFDVSSLGSIMSSAEMAPALCRAPWRWTSEASTCAAPS